MFFLVLCPHPFPCSVSSSCWLLLYLWVSSGQKHMKSTTFPSVTCVMLWHLKFFGGLNQYSCCVCSWGMEMIQSLHDVSYGKQVSYYRCKELRRTAIHSRPRQRLCRGKNVWGFCHTVSVTMKGCGFRHCAMNCGLYSRNAMPLH